MKSVSEARSRNMAAIRSSNTSIEVSIRSELHRRGFRFRKHVKSLPGSPDIVLPRYRTAIFVHGCFWHRHEGCKRTTHPQTNVQFWSTKFQTNVERDARNQRLLNAAGWRTLVVWGCEVETPESLQKTVDKISKALVEP